MSVTLPYRGVVLPFDRTCTGNLAAGADLSSGTSKSEVVCVAGAARVRAYLKASIAGTLTLNFVRPTAADGTVSGDSVIDPTLVTKRTASAPASIPVTANTEAEIHADCYGEGYALVTFAYTAAGGATVTYCDVCAV